MTAPRRAGTPVQTDSNPAYGTDWRTFDEVVLRYLKERPDINDRWLLLQAILTSASRRALLGTLQPRAGWRTLDLGCGFGPVTLEMAGMLPINSVGVDSDRKKIEVALALAAGLRDMDWFPPGSDADFEVGDAYALKHEAEGFDLVTAQFLFQHLKNPRSVISEIRRVLKTGGTVCIVDIDAALSTTYPELPQELSVIVGALSEVLDHNGGDRSVGRKVASYLDEEGFTVTRAHVMAQASFRSPASDFIERACLLDRIEATRTQIVDHGILTDAEIEACIEAIAGADNPKHFILGGHLAIVATKV